jgi:hypothetical protein
MANKIGSKVLMRNSFLKPFETLVGGWQTTGSHPYFPNTKLNGRVSFEWIEDGAFVMMRSEIDHPKFPDGIAIFGSDDELQKYYMIYFDVRGVSRIYEASITESQLKWWRDDSQLSQRFTMAINEDKLVTSGEMSRNGGRWEKDLSLTYKKL